MKLKCEVINTSFEHDRPADFLTSQWQTKEKSVTYLIYRWSIAIFFVLSFLISVSTATVRLQIQFYPIYLTHWNLLFTTISMLVAAFLVTLHNKGQFNLSTQMNRELKAYWFLSTSCNTYAFLISLIYWTVLYKNETDNIDLNNVIVHITNSLVLVIDIAVVRHPGRFGLAVYHVSCGVLFAVFSWVYPFLGGVNRKHQNFIYPILDWNQNPARAFIASLGVMLAGVIIHSLIVLAHRLRAKIHSKLSTTVEKKTDVYVLTC